MASLKQQIEAAALRIGSRGGMPADNGEIAIDKTVTSYVAPCDGYCFMRCNCVGSGKIAISVIESGLEIYWRFDVNGEVDPAMCVPVKKGQTVSFMHYNLNSGVSIMGKAFYPTLGSST